MTFSPGRRIFDARDGHILLQSICLAEVDEMEY
jgi:hypothetical protein